MKEGFYRLDFQGEDDFGFAVLALDTEMVVGADWAGGKYDGTYSWNKQTELLDMEVTVWIPEGVRVVQGNTAGPDGREFTATCSFPRDPDNQVIQATTDLGPVSVRISLLRTFD